ncbi:MAG: phage baseplate assembly protein [Elusimicrobia bacterium]|nr:phage baseplate assembly protein [Elusimicrobiota bacterium]
MIRALIVSVAEGVIKRFSGSSAHGALESRELFQHYGFTSRAKAGAEAIVLRDGNIFISIAEDDRRYRLAIAEGEVALYSDEGDSVHFKRGREIEITAGTKVKITAPTMELSGNLQVTGSVSDSAGSMAAMRLAYNPHTHIDPQGGVTGGPAPTM